MTEPAILGLPEIGTDAPAIQLAFRVTALAHETAMIARKGRVILIDLHPAGPYEGELAMGLLPDEDTAEVQFANILDGFRREGWTLRDPEPWEITDPTDAPVPF